jgi:hypothetical protein
VARHNVPSFKSLICWLVFFIWQCFDGCCLSTLYGIPPLCGFSDILSWHVASAGWSYGRIHYIQRQASLSRRKLYCPLSISNSVITGQTGSSMLPFLVFTDTSGPDDKTRRFIRSHVMLGKNRRKRPSRRSVDEAVQQTFPIDSTLGKSKDPRIPSSMDDSALPRIPSKVGSDLSSIQFADNVDASVIETVIRCECIPLHPLLA